MNHRITAKEKDEEEVKVKEERDYRQRGVYML
jgi:ribosomal protein S30